MQVSGQPVFIDKAGGVVKFYPRDPDSMKLPKFLLFVIHEIYKKKLSLAKKNKKN